jgi:hypothetical protein
MSAYQIFAGYLVSVATTDLFHNVVSHEDRYFIRPGVKYDFVTIPKFGRTFAEKSSERNNYREYPVIGKWSFGYLNKKSIDINITSII